MADIFVIGALIKPICSQERPCIYGPSGVFEACDRAGGYILEHVLLSLCFRSQRNCVLICSSEAYWRFHLGMGITVGWSLRDALLVFWVSTLLFVYSPSTWSVFEQRYNIICYFYEISLVCMYRLDWTRESTGGPWDSGFESLADHV